MSELTIEFTSWLDDIISKASDLIDFGSPKKREYRKKIIYLIVYVCIKEIILWLDLKDAKTALIKIADINNGELLPEGQESIRKRYEALNILKNDLGEKGFYKIKQIIDHDLISAPESQIFIKAIDRRMNILRSTVIRNKVKTGGAPKDPLFNSILYMCDRAFEHNCDQIIHEKIALFVNAIFSNDSSYKKKTRGAVRGAIKYIINNAEGESKEEKYSSLEKEWERLRKRIKLK